MKLPQKYQHPWQVTPAEAIAIQRQLASHIRLQDHFKKIRRVAGVDVGFEQDGRITRAAIAVLTFPALELVTSSIARVETRFPYIPGLLSFRELPAVLQAMQSLQTIPDLLLCDGQGYAHPRRLGIASHLGLLTDVPSIGVGKTRLLGQHDELPDRRGAWVPLYDKGEQIGVVLRTRVGVKPIYVSPGHKISFTSAVEYVMACTTRYKLPETTRWAHRLASQD